MTNISMSIRNRAFLTNLEGIRKKTSQPDRKDIAGRSEIQELYQNWLHVATEDDDLVKELAAMEGNLEWMEDAFYRTLSFGTGGLRGIIGAGTNRMNIYTVARASQGLADYVKEHFKGTDQRIAVSYDSRIKSVLFARTAAGVFADNGIRVLIYPELMPTPCLSYAVRRMGCAAGIMVTASHNPADYNGYKVYGADGCQITEEAAEEIQKKIESAALFAGVRKSGFVNGLEKGLITYIGRDIVSDFIEQVKKQSVLSKEDRADKSMRIVYSPLNGTGLKPVLRVLRESGYTNITVVKEQEQPDGHFPTCPYPNPELPEAMALGMEYAEKCRADLVIATDPDCDRVGVAVRDREGVYTRLTGNETGMLLLDYICSQRRRHKTMPERPLFLKTIVTIDMAERIAEHYGVRCMNVLTGFKYIGEQIGALEQAGQTDSFIFGFEESYGCLSGSYVRDKDAVGGAFLICEMAAFYRAQGKTLPDRLGELYAQYGYCLNTLHSYTFEGAVGFSRMRELMKHLRFGGMKAIGAYLGEETVVRCLDYSAGIDGLPKADVLKFTLKNHGSVVIRPSGTEPKIKVYVSISAESREAAAVREQRLAKALEAVLM